MVKLALFDFCETLVSFQTADAFVDYVRNKKGSIFLRFLDEILIILIRLRVFLVLNKLFPGESRSKKLKLLQIRNMSYDDLDHLAGMFYNDMIKPNLILPVVEEMTRLAKEGYEICLVSAGYSIYLKYFMREYKIPHMISTEIAFNSYGIRCLGTIAGKDCISEEKVNRIKDYFTGKELNLSESISFSDSISDLPMLLYTQDAVVVSKEVPQRWISQHKFREIIWNKSCLVNSALIKY
jgi:HAD superfamily hydrolase (TIGR01490 family)